MEKTGKQLNVSEREIAEGLELSSRSLSRPDSEMQRLRPTINIGPELLRKYDVSPLESVPAFRALFRGIGSTKMHIFIFWGERPLMDVWFEELKERVPVP